MIILKKIYKLNKLINNNNILMIIRKINKNNRLTSNNY